MCHILSGISIASRSITMPDLRLTKKDTCVLMSKVLRLASFSKLHVTA